MTEEVVLVGRGGGTADVPVPAPPDDPAPGPPRVVWRAVRDGAQVVDLRLVRVEGDRRAFGLPVQGAAKDASLSALLPDAAVDGRLAGLCAVAEDGRPFRLTRPASGSRPSDVLVAHRSGTDEVVVTLEPPVDRPETRDEQRWQRLVDDTRVGVLVLTWDGFVLEANRAVGALLGRPLHEVVGRRLHDFAFPQDTTRVDRELLLRTGHARLLKRYRHGDGSERWLRSTVSLVVEEGERRMLVFCEDATQTQQALAELAHRATHDGLTGLPNRETLRARLQQALAEVRSGARGSTGLLFVDLDRFKVINDSLGHAAGDRLLREVADRLQAGTPPVDLLARLGGDEFAVVTDAERAPELAAGLVDALERPFVVDGREVTVGASVGIALRTGDDVGDDPQSLGAAVDALLREADTAMYAAKRAGDGPVVVFRDTLRRRALARLEDEQGLRRALAGGELRVHYQPIVRLSDSRTVACEALVRWQHPERGLLGPGAFLSTAEDAGLVVPLGRLVLTEACAQLARWRDEGQDLRMSVNVAAQHLAAGTLRDDVDEALASAGVEASSLTLEITEQALVVSHVRAAAVLADLRRRGCRIALDDFGTGYSSLAYLRQLPVDVLKIDRTFITGAGTGANDSALLSAITALARSLGLETVAEGIENDGELAAARAAGATHVQGHLLGRPAPA